MPDIEKVFEQAGAVLKGHFLLASGRHSPVYWEKFQVLQFPQYTVELCRMIADHFRQQNVQLIAGPTTGGVILAFDVARQLGVRGIFAEKEGNNQGRVFRRGFTIHPGERVLVVDDILTTGSSVRETMSAVTGQQGIVIGVGVLVDRSERAVDFGVPLFSCLRSKTVTYATENCPLCQAKMPLVKPGGS
ncbi:MAG: orotate phosphoribosyltransferase [Chloroflexi bacterium]|nr:orotate phosphoribosyltransferase [Chloroflexota bacterium]